MILSFKNIFFLFLFLSIANISYSYDPLKENLTLEYNNYCAGLETTFTLYNKTQYDFAKENKLKACRLNQTEETHNCIEFDIISNAAIKVYNGPFDSNELLFEGKSNSKSQFNVIFPNSVIPLIYIIPNSNYNIYYNNNLYIENCPHIKTSLNDSNNLVNDSILVDNSTNIEDNTSSILQNFSLNETINTETNNDDSNNILINNSQINSIIDNKSQVNFSFDEDKLKIIFESESNLLETLSDSDFFLDLNYSDASLEDSIYAFEIKLNFEYPLKTKFNIKEELIPNFEYTILYKTEMDLNWKELNYQYNETYFSIEDIQSGYYAITKKEIISNQVSSENLQIDETKNSASLNLDIIGIINKYKFYILIGFSIIVILFILMFFISHNKKNSINAKEEKLKKDKIAMGQTENMPYNYNQVYTNALNYITMYKDKYPKESLIISLQKANCPNDILERVLNEVYR